MAYNIVHYDESSNSIQKFSSEDLTNLAEEVLQYMAAGTYTGSITIGTDNPIGTFTDTVLQGEVGSSDITVLSNMYTLSQVNTATLTAEVNPPKYVGLDVEVGTTILQENLTTLEDLADEIISHMVNGGSNSYYLGTIAPNDGGVWTSLGTLKDTLENFTVTIDTYHLWKKTSSGSTVTYKKPLKLSSGSLQNFSETEVRRLAKIIEQRIITTQVGTYVIQSAIPSTGLWSSAGTITDTRRVYTGAEFDGSSFDAVYTGVNPDGTTFTSVYYYTYYYNPSYSGTSTTTVGYFRLVPINFVGGGGPAYTGPGGTFGSTGPTEFPFFGPGPSYVGSYIGPAIGATAPGYNYYLGPLESNFSGAPSYATTYTSIAVGSDTEIITTTTLWKRVG